MKKFGEYCALLILSGGSFLFASYTFMKLWEWLVVYAFAVNPLNLIQSIGIIVFCRFYTIKYPNLKDTKKRSFDIHMESIFKINLISLSGLLLGHIITYFQ
jgi:hypothetical protein